MSALVALALAPVRDCLVPYLDFGTRVALQQACTCAATGRRHVELGVPSLDDLRQLWVPRVCRAEFFSWLYEDSDLILMRDTTLGEFIKYMKRVVLPCTDNATVQSMIALACIYLDCAQCIRQLFEHVLTANVLYDKTPGVTHAICYARGGGQIVQPRVHPDDYPMIKMGDTFVRLLTCQHRRHGGYGQRSAIDVEHPRIATADARVVVGDTGACPMDIVCESRLALHADMPIFCMRAAGMFIVRKRPAYTARC